MRKLLAARWPERPEVPLRARRVRGRSRSTAFAWGVATTVVLSLLAARPAIVGGADEPAGGPAAPPGVPASQSRMGDAAAKGTNPAAPATRAATLTGAVLEDTTGRAWALGEIASQPVLLIVAGRKGSDQAVAWGEGLHRSHPGGLALWATPGEPRNAVVISDADLHEVPGVLRGLVRWRIAAVVADRVRAGHVGPPLLLDWEGVVAHAVEADTSSDAIVVLLDRDRSERARFSGAPDETKLAAPGAALDAVGTPGAARAAAAESAPASAAGTRP